MVNFQPYLDYLYGLSTIGKDKIEQTHKSEITSEIVAPLAAEQQHLEALPGSTDQRIDNIRFSVDPKVYLTDAMLEVTNQSQIETFHGTVRIVINDNYSLETHRLYWDGYGAEANLGNGDVANVQIAKWEWRSQQMIAVHLIESVSGNPNSLMPHLYKVQNGVIEDPKPIYLEVVIKPMSSSRIEHRAYYSVEPSIKKPMIFHRIDSIPAPSNLEIEVVETHVNTVPMDTQTANTAVFAIVNLRPSRPMQLAKITLDCEEGLLDIFAANPALPNLLERNETHEIEFRLPLGVNGLPQKHNNFATEWYIREQLRIGQNQSRSEGRLRVIADAREWISPPFPVPTIVGEPIVYPLGRHFQNLAIMADQLAERISFLRSNKDNGCAATGNIIDGLHTTDASCSLSISGEHGETDNGGKIHRKSMGESLSARDAQCLLLHFNQLHPDVMVTDWRNITSQNSNSKIVDELSILAQISPRDFMVCPNCEICQTLTKTH